jgi:uncharacterized FAD-dependent dehydrogenase
MLRIRQIKMPIHHNLEDLKNKIAKKLNISPKEITTLKINKKSIDARKELTYVYEVDIQINNENKILNRHLQDILKTPDESYNFPNKGLISLKHRPIIIGSGPAGLFAGYMLAKNGYKPIIIEKGENIDKRIKTVEKFWEEGILNPTSNVQFGAGGAGTFSDGKLNTQVKDKEYRDKEILKIFVENGAPEDIIYLNKPHIGTDLLRNTIKNILDKIEQMGGTIQYETNFNDIVIKNNKLVAIKTDKEEIPCEVLILAIGHSSRDTFTMLLNKGLTINPKPFAVGIRIQHPQKLININQYKQNNPSLPQASYKLTYTTKKRRGVYSFCMCPGGFVVNSSSEENHLAINGMSNHLRDSENANSAIIVTVTPDDFGNAPLDGIKYQRILEENAYKIGNGKIPIQLFKDFVNNQKTTKLGYIKPIFKGKYELSNLNEIMPNYICEALKEGINNFSNKIKGFNDDNAILAAIESRTSSPVKIPRDENYNSNILGIYPCGEGSGYSGGIMTSAMDGIKVAEAIAQKYN